ncbi:pyridoxal-phosphate dependent enzyme [Micrococcus luteus]|uniref:pyridoxal-phosphate dependent enzyme n=1 Tax=Micrococcus luteus TaxID=1270 RepID=UPI001F15579D|nr:pyridoxal-phosphate dependent enzyme [Micrococcus luteus]
MQYAENVLELIGRTPLVKLHSVTEGIEATVLVKVEYLNPGGSVKDRIALKMIEEAEREGLLGPGGTVVEPTSGNTGVGLALVSQLKGYRTVFVTPDKVGQEKRDVLSAYGAELVVTPTAVDPTSEESYYGVADRLVREIPGAYQPNQFFNPAAPASHYETTGPEIWEDTAGRVTHVVMGAGTGGTITGTGRYLKEVSADRPSGPVRVIGADPSGSVYSGGAGRPYFVEGVGEDMWVDNYDPAVPDEVIAVEDADALAMTRRLAAEEGLLVGGSSGLAVVARTPITGVRKVIADQLTRSRREVPEVTAWLDVDVTALLELRAALKAKDPENAPSLLGLIARFTLAGLRRYPVMNARIEAGADGKDEIVEVDGVHLGLAVQTDRGLMVPSVEHAEKLSADELTAAINDTVSRARAGRAAPAELTRGTFTLNNYGPLGTDGATPIINVPEVGMLGIGRIIDRPWVVDGEIVVRKVTEMTVTFDHRVTDGATASAFLTFVADCLHDPTAALARI